VNLVYISREKNVKRFPTVILAEKVSQNIIVVMNTAAATPPKMYSSSTSNKANNVTLPKTNFERWCDMDQKINGSSQTIEDYRMRLYHKHKTVLILLQLLKSEQYKLQAEQVGWTDMTEEKRKERMSAQESCWYHEALAKQLCEMDDEYMVGGYMDADTLVVDHEDEERTKDELGREDSTKRAKRALKRKHGEAFDVREIQRRLEAKTAKKEIIQFTLPPDMDHMDCVPLNVNMDYAKFRNSVKMREYVKAKRQ
jgi:hypothetical protein